LVGLRKSTEENPSDKRESQDWTLCVKTNLKSKCKSEKDRKTERQEDRKTE